MPTSLLPGWAPNLHPLVVHFPIVLLLMAIAVDLGALAVKRSSWLYDTSTSLYAMGTLAAVAAFATGVQAASTVFVPGMAHVVVGDHRTWALVTTTYFGLLAVARVAARRPALKNAWGIRSFLLVLGVAGGVLLQQAAERGARLVYEFGTGVIGRAPGP